MEECVKRLEKTAHVIDRESLRLGMRVLVYRSRQLCHYDYCFLASAEHHANDVIKRQMIVSSKLEALSREQ